MSDVFLGLFLGLTELIGALGGWVMAVPATLDERFGALAPVVAGAATAIAVAIVMAIYFRGGYHASRDIVRHGVATIVVLGLLTFVASDARHTAPDYLGLNRSKPAAEFETRSPKATVLADASETQVELRVM
jgi:hypothetical protein